MDPYLSILIDLAVGSTETGELTAIMGPSGKRWSIGDSWRSRCLDTLDL